MLITDWNLEEAQQAWLAQGRTEGIKIGIGKGRDEGRNEGREERDKEVLELIAKGCTLEEIQRELSATVGRIS